MLDEIDRIFVSRVGRPPCLEVDVPIVRLGIVAAAAILDRGRRKTGRQLPALDLAPGGAGLDVVIVLLAADPAIILEAIERAGAAKIGLAAPLPLKSLHRLLGDQVDGAAEPARPVQHRDIALGDLDLRDVVGQETREVDAVVGRQIDAHAVNRQRHLQPVKTVNENVAVVALIAARRGIDARHQIERLIDRVGLEALHLRIRHGAAAEIVELRAALGRRRDVDLPQLIHALTAARDRRVNGRDRRGAGKQHGDSAHSFHQAPLRLTHPRRQVGAAAHADGARRKIVTIDWQQAAAAMTALRRTGPRMRGARGDRSAADLQGSWHLDCTATAVRDRGQCTRRIGQSPFYLFHLHILATKACGLTIP